jgi:hypothetical protein
MSSHPANEHESPGTAGAHGTRENRRSAVSGVLIGIAFVIVLCVGITDPGPTRGLPDTDSFAGLRFGRVPLQLLHHADVPVVIVPAAHT